MQNKKKCFEVNKCIFTLSSFVIPSTKPHNAGVGQTWSVGFVHFTLAETFNAVQINNSYYSVCCVPFFLLLFLA